MKSVFWMIPGAIVLMLLFFACNTRNRKKVPEQELPVEVPGDVEPEDNTFPRMKLEVRGITFTLNVGDGIVGQYDKEEGYWVCSDDEPVFQTSPNTYGDKKYSLLEVRDKDGMGLVDDKGTIIILPMYTSLEMSFTNGFCKVQDKDGKSGLIAEDGRMILPVIYDDIRHDDIKEGLIKVSGNGLQGFTDLQGEIVIPLRYEVLEQGGDGMIWFMQEPQKWGCLNYKNEIVVQPEFTHTAQFVNGKAKAQKGTYKEYLIYTDGKVEEMPDIR